MKTKQKIISCALVGSIIASSFLALVLNGSKPFLSVLSNPKDDATLTLDASNRLEGVSWGHATKTYQNGFTTIEYFDANSNEGWHVQLGGNGYLFKQEASNSIKSIRVTKESNGTLLIESDYVPTFDSNARYEEWFTGTDETFYVVGNYWRIRNVSGGSTSVCISSITVTYDCYDEDYQTADSNASISSWVDFDSRYTIQEVDGATCFTMRGYSDYHLLPSQLFIRDDGGTVMSCAFIRYRRDSRFEAFFDLDSFYVNNPNYNGEFVVHLFVNNHAWDNGYGDVYSRYDENNTSAPAATPAGSVQMINASWNNDQHTHPAALVFKNDAPHVTSMRLEDTGTGVDLIFTGVGVNSSNLPNLKFDLQRHSGVWDLIGFDTNDGLTRSLDSTGVWTIRANIASIEDEVNGYGVHLLYGDNSIDMERVGYQLTNFETSYAAAFKLTIARWWDRDMIGLFTGYEYLVSWSSNGVFDASASVLVWAWGNGIADSWYDTIWIDNYNAIKVILPSRVTGFKLARFPNGTTASNAQWGNQWNETQNDVSIVSGTYEYSINWGW